MWAQCHFCCLCDAGWSFPPSCPNGRGRIWPFRQLNSILWSSHCSFPYMYGILQPEFSPGAIWFPSWQSRQEGSSYGRMHLWPQSELTKDENWIWFVFFFNPFALWQTAAKAGYEFLLTMSFFTIKNKLMQFQRKPIFFKVHCLIGDYIDKFIADN